MLEDKVRHQDRAHLRLKHANLIRSVPIYVQIHYEPLHYDCAPGQPPLVGELYTETEPVSNAALRRGHKIATSITLKTRFNLMLTKDRRRATTDLNANRPFCLVIAFPCSVWSSLANLTAERDPRRRARLEQRRKLEKMLVEYAAERAADQVLHGSHFMIENPSYELSLAPGGQTTEDGRESPRDGLVLFEVRTNANLVCADLVEDLIKRRQVFSRLQDRWLIAYEVDYAHEFMNIIRSLVADE